VPARRTLLATALALPAIARAQALWPARPLTWVVPFPPGGITDNTARLIAEGLRPLLGQPIVIENRPGAGGSIGAEWVARAAPDGYTLLYGTQGTQAANLALYRGLRYDPLRDFAAIHAIAATPNLLVANPTRPFASVAALLEAARRDPGGITFASSGVGTSTHLSGELFQVVTGVRFTHVPYHGAARALNDLVGGTVDIMFDNPVTTIPLILTGRLRGLAVTAAARVPLVPDVPTLREAGVTGADSASWAGMFAPARTPPAILDRLADGIATVLRDPAVRESFAASGRVPQDGLRGDVFAAHIAAEIPRWREIVERSGARLE